MGGGIFAIILIQIIMKRLVVLLALAVSSAALFAQSYKVGDAVLMDGIPCVVIEVDGTGQHGMVMSLPPTFKKMKEVAKIVKKGGEPEWFYVPKKVKGKEIKQNSKYLEEYFERYKDQDTVKVKLTNVLSVTRQISGRSGKDDIQNALEFCESEGLNFEKVFPIHNWALSLGPEWFLPGLEECKVLAEFYGIQGFGVKSAERILTVTHQLLADYQKSMTDLGPDAMGFADVYFPTAPCLATSLRHKQALLQMTCVTRTIDFKSWFIFAPLGSTTPMYCAMRRF